MSKSAQDSVKKFIERAAVAGEDYVKGVRETSKDQSARAIAAKEIYKQALTASFSRDSYAKGLGKSGKAGHLAGVESKGKDRFGPGLAVSGPKYVAESGRFDVARNSSANMPTGLKGSPTNLAKVAKVVAELRAVKLAA